MLGIETITKCQLKCRFCLGHGIKVKQRPTMTLDKFKIIVDKCVDFGVDDFELTPIVGEFFLDRTWLQKLKYLENIEQIKCYDFFSNFINLNDKEIIELAKLKKINLEISVYGFDRNSFKQFTGRDYFDKFIHNIKLLFKLYKSSKCNCKSISFSIRIKNFSRDSEMWKIMKIMNIFSNVDVRLSYKVSNLGGLIKPNSFEDEVEIPKHTGICENAVRNMIVENGNVTLCACDSNYKKTVIGNIFEQHLNEIYAEDSIFSKIFTNQNNLIYSKTCNKCNNFEIIHKYQIKKLATIIPWIKKYENSIVNYDRE